MGKRYRQILPVTQVLPYQPIPARSIEATRGRDVAARLARRPRNVTCARGPPGAVR